MGIPLDNRMVEYAYPHSEKSEYHISTTDEQGNITWKHKVIITWELQDSNHVFLCSEAITHFTEETPVRDTAIQTQKRIVTAMQEWIRADKLQLSGYDIEN